MTSIKAVFQNLTSLRGPTDEARRDSLHEALALGKTRSLERQLSKLSDSGLLDAPNAQGETLLHAAVQKGDYDAVELLLSKGADPDVLDTHRNSTPLHTAARMNDSHLLSILLRYGANPDVYDRDGRTPLHLQAERMGSGHAVEWLINAGANLDAKDHGGITPLMFAVGANARDCAQVLIDRGANIHVTDDNGRSALSRALELVDERVQFGQRSNQSDLAIKLLEKGARLSDSAMCDAFVTAAKLGNWKLLGAVLDRHPAALNACDSTGKTALHHAALHDNERIVDFLLHHGAQADRKDHKGFIPRDYVNERSAAAKTFARYAPPEPNASRPNAPPPQQEQHTRSEQRAGAAAPKPRGAGAMTDWMALELEGQPTSKSEVIKAWKNMMLKYHPDKNPGREAECNEIVHLLTAARDRLLSRLS